MKKKSLKKKLQNAGKEYATSVLPESHKENEKNGKLTWLRSDARKMSWMEHDLNLLKEKM